MSATHSYSAQTGASDLDTAPNSRLIVPRRSPITVQTYDMDAEVVDEIMGRATQGEIPNVRRLILPITYVDRETLKRMR